MSTFIEIYYSWNITLKNFSKWNVQHVFLSNFWRELKLKGKKLEKLLKNRSNYVLYPNESLHCFFIASGIFLEEKRGKGEKEKRKISGKQETLRKKYGRGYLRKSAVFERLHFALCLSPFPPPLFPLFVRWIAFRKSAAIIDVPGCPVRRSWCEVTMNNLVACVYMQMSWVKEFLRVLKAKNLVASLKSHFCVVRLLGGDV